MSFSLMQKQEIAKQPIKSLCCRRAFINGILFSKGVALFDEVTLSLDASLPLDFIFTLIKEHFGKSAMLSSGAGGGRRKILRFNSRSAHEYITSVTNDSAELFKQKCPFCFSHFLRGVFFSCGRVSDPQKQYRLEFVPVGDAEFLKRYLLGAGISLSLARQRDIELLYTSNSSVIEDFFAAAGMNNTAFLFMNTKIEGELKNSVNRIRNCETNNIDKSVSASAKQSAAIEALDKANLLSMLPDELETTARMRLKYRDYSLARLAAEFTPPISKPGLSHRLNKIVQISERLLSKDKE